MFFVVGGFMWIGLSMLLQAVSLIYGLKYVVVYKRIVDPELPIFPDRETITINPARAFRLQLHYYHIREIPQADPRLEMLRQRSRRFQMWALMWAAAGWILAIIGGIIDLFI